MKLPLSEKDTVVERNTDYAVSDSSIDIPLDDMPTKRKRRKNKLKAAKPFRLTPLSGILGLFALVVVIALVFSAVSGIKENRNKNIDTSDEAQEAVIDQDIADAVNNYKYNYHQFSSQLLIPYHGDVTYLSFEPIVSHPKLAYDRDEYQQGIDGRSLTAGEFKAILQKLYDDGFILVNINEAVESESDKNGTTTVSKGELKLPQGKKPLVIILENYAYSDVMAQNGYIQKLIIQKTGGTWDYSVDENGVTCITRENDAITILDAFLTSHPEFSLNGAKGCIALTGSEGVLGYKTQLGVDKTERNQAISDVSFVIKQLKKTGWSFACNTYSHTNVMSSDFAALTADLSSWTSEVGRIVGGTSILVLPDNGGSELLDMLTGLEVYAYLKSMGFDRFVISGTTNNLSVLTDGSAAFISGRRIDGAALRNNGQLLSDLFNADEILDLTTRLSFSVR